MNSSGQRVTGAQSSSDGQSSSGQTMSAQESVSEFDRERLLATHPVITGKFEIPTPPILRACDIMARTVATGAPSCAFAAFPRFGKTWAASYSRKRLAEAFPVLPIVSFHAHHAQRPNKQRFYADLLEQTGFGDARGKSREDVRKLLVRAWWSLTQASGSTTLAIMGDEMQALWPDEYSWLIDLTNDLHELNVRAISILFGQPELGALRAVFRETHRGDILGRFMSRFFAFEGIGSANELREVMRCYDDPAQIAYPPDSGCSFTQFFFPEAYANGWRLTTCAGACWEQFCLHATTRLSTPAKVQRLSIGMEWVVGTLREAFTHCSDLDRPALQILADQWGGAVERSGFVDSLGLTYNPDWMSTT